MVRYLFVNPSNQHHWTAISYGGHFAEMSDRQVVSKTNKNNENKNSVPVVLPSELKLHFLFNNV